jgi:ribosomal protein S18 acetylase RimI-like enzyme
LYFEKKNRINFNRMIRQLQAADAILYRNVRLEALKNEPHSYLSAYEIESAKPELFLERCLNADDPHNIVFGAFSNEKLVGIIAFVISQAEVIQFYVDPKYRGHGLGRKLLTTILDEAFRRFKELDFVHIDVVLKKKNAGDLYRSVGFAPVRLDAAAVIKENCRYDILGLKISRSDLK